MITLVCTKCSTTLNVDDGFAGGVCRCSNCGTIQTVPARGQKVAAGEAIFERPTRGTSRDLEALGDVVTSSGLAGSGMLRQSRQVPNADAAKSRMMPIVVGGVVGALLAAGLVLWLTLGSGKSEAPAATPSAPAVVPVGEAAIRKSGPSFGPIVLDANGPVVYLVDRGDATRAFTASLQRAVLRSVSSLGATRKFQVRYWSADGESPAFPTTPAEATPQNIGRLTTWMADIVGGPATDPTASLNEALAVKPAEIVMLTGKAWQLDESFANEATVKLSGMKVRIHAVALGGSTGSEALPRIAARTGGTFVEMDEPTLAAIGK